MHLSAGRRYHLLCGSPCTRLARGPACQVARGSRSTEWARRRHGRVYSHMVMKQESQDQSPGSQALGCVLPRAAPGSAHGAADTHFWKSE